MTLPHKMQAVLLTGHGGLKKLEFRVDVAVPQPKPDEVLIKVAAAGINNTDINTRIGWYSKSVEGATDQAGASGFNANEDDGGWAGVPLAFPLIQGADICGHVVAVGEAVDKNRVGERVLVRSMFRIDKDGADYQFSTMGSERNGGFAQYATALARETLAVNSTWTDAELASIPCAYSTAENMLQRANVGAERVLITGASGGVGSAAVQLAKRRGAQVVAIASLSKVEAVKAIGADQVIDRNADLVAALGEGGIDVVIDLVGGPQWPSLLGVLRRGGRYAVAGAIAGPLVETDLRTLYLKDLTFFGCTFQQEIVFENLIQYIEANEIRPIVAKTYPLSDIRQAQTDFLEKAHTGKLVLIPWRSWG